MTSKQTIYTFHQAREKCPQGSAEAWRAFFSLYGPLAAQLLNFYAAGDPTGWERTVDSLTRNNFEGFRNMPQQSEREFLMAMRAETMEHAAAALANKVGETPPATKGLDLARVVKALEGSPLLHQEMIW